MQKKKNLSAFFLAVLTVMLFFFCSPTETESLIQKPKFWLLDQTFGFVSAQPLPKSKDDIIGILFYL